MGIGRSASPDRPETPSSMPRDDAEERSAFTSGHRALRHRCHVCRIIEIDLHGRLWMTDWYRSRHNVSAVPANIGLMGFLIGLESRHEVEVDADSQQASTHMPKMVLGGLAAREDRCMRVGTEMGDEGVVCIVN